MATTFTEDNFDAEVVTSADPVLVDFWAPWCAPCRQLAPLIDELAEENEGNFKVGKVDTDQNPNLAMKYGVQHLPTLMIFKDGEVVKQWVGGQPKEVLQGALESAKG